MVETPQNRPPVSHQPERSITEFKPDNRGFIRHWVCSGPNATAVNPPDAPRQSVILSTPTRLPTSVITGGPRARREGLALPGPWNKLVCGKGRISPQSPPPGPLDGDRSRLEQSGRYRDQGLDPEHTRPLVWDRPPPSFRSALSHRSITFPDDDCVSAAGSNENRRLSSEERIPVLPLAVRAGAHRPGHRCRHRLAWRSSADPLARRDRCVARIAIVGRGASAIHTTARRAR